MAKEDTAEVSKNHDPGGLAGLQRSKQGRVYTCGKERSAEVVMVLLKERNVFCE